MELRTPSRVVESEICTASGKSQNLSIIVPCFNASGTLAAAIESGLQQGLSVPEIVVSDDGSNDGSLEAVRRLESRVRVLSGPNRGVSAARNWGIDESAGEWLIFLDADDQLLPGTVEKRLKAAAENPQADVVACGWQELIDDWGGTTPGAVRAIDRAAMEADAEVATATHAWAPPAALMYRRSLVERIGGFRLDLPVIQDARFLFDAAYHGARFAFSDHVGALYRIQPGSLSRRNPARFWKDILLNGTQIEALWRARGPLSAKQRDALAGIYNHAARGLFAAESPHYFDAIKRQLALGGPLPRHSRIVPPVARALGLRSARRLFAMVGR